VEVEVDILNLDMIRVLEEEQEEMVGLAVVLAGDQLEEEEGEDPVDQTGITEIVQEEEEMVVINHIRTIPVLVMEMVEGELAVVILQNRAVVQTV
jgi:hypothetical protein